MNSPNHQKELQIPMEILKDKYYTYLTSSYHSNYFEKESFSSLLSRQKQELNEIQKIHVKQLERQYKKAASLKVKRHQTTSGASLAPECSNDYSLEHKHSIQTTHQQKNQQSTPPHYQQLNFSDWMFPSNCFSNCDYSLEENSLDLFEELVHQESRMAQPNSTNQIPQIMEEDQQLMQNENDDVSFSQKQSQFRELFINDTTPKMQSKEFHFCPGQKETICNQLLSPQFSPLCKPPNQDNQINLLPNQEYFDMSLNDNDSNKTKMQTETQQTDQIETHLDNYLQQNMILSMNKGSVTSEPPNKFDLLKLNKLQLAKSNSLLGQPSHELTTQYYDEKEINQQKLNDKMFEEIQNFNFIGPIKMANNDGQINEKDEIYQVQGCLNIIYPGQVLQNGQYGHFSEKYVKQFQKDNSLLQDGVVTKGVWDKLTDVVANKLDPTKCCKQKQSSISKIEQIKFQQQKASEQAMKNLENSFSNWFL